MHEIDESRIREEIEARHYRVTITEDWLTPSGNPRKVPMYFTEIENEHLGLTKVVKGRLPEEVRDKASRQLEQWEARELRQRIAAAKEDLRDRAEELSREASAELDELRGTLAATLDFDDRVDWEALLERREFVPEVFTPEPAPERPKRHALTYLWPPVWRRKVEAHDLAVQRHEREMGARLAVHQEKQAKAKSVFEASKAEKNASIRAFREAFEQGDRSAVEEYLGMVFERASYPARMTPVIEAHYDEGSATVIADVSAPGPGDVSDVARFKLTDRNRRIDTAHLKAKEHEELYDDAVKQLSLRVMHEAFESLYTPHVARVVVNVWTTTVNQATGHDDTSCILSVSADRGEFEALNLARIDATACVKQLKGLLAGPLSSLAPVQPIMVFNREDPRFVESREALAEINSMTNLAEVPWEEFEHLVRELFSKMFNHEGAEVKVTRSSSDGGVDAIVFDPDPIRGGKFVIQAKRYTKAVPVSAARDLYGTMLNEGAAKGLLVTTAHFGSQTREFAKDKPITLIDGSNLVYLLEEQGHRVRIDIEAARRNR